MEETIRLEKVYSNINGEETGRNPLEAVCEGKKVLVAEWYGVASKEGKNYYALWSTPLGLFLRRSWVPGFGYSWEEEVIYKLILPGEAEEQ